MEHPAYRALDIAVALDHPQRSFLNAWSVGSGAVESFLERMNLPVKDASLSAYALSLQLPMEGPLTEGGLKFVLRTSRHWLGCVFQGQRNDMFISLQEDSKLAKVSTVSLDFSTANQPTSAKAPENG